MAIGVGEGVGQAGRNLLAILIARDEAERSAEALSQKLMLPIMAQAEQNALNRAHEEKMENMRTARENAQKEYDAKIKREEKLLDLQTDLEMQDRLLANQRLIASINATKTETGKISPAEALSLKDRFDKELMGEDFDAKRAKIDEAKLQDLNTWEKATPAGRKRLGEIGNKNFQMLWKLEENPQKDEKLPLGLWSVNKPITRQERLATLDIDTENLQMALARKKIGTPKFESLVGLDEPTAMDLYSGAASTAQAALADTSLMNPIERDIWGAPEAAPTDTSSVVPTNDPRAMQDAEYNAIMGR